MLKTSMSAAPQLIHHRCDTLPRDHRGDGHPVRVLERGDGGRAFPGGDFGGGFETAAGDVVLAEDVFLGRWGLGMG